MESLAPLLRRVAAVAVAILLVIGSAAPQKPPTKPIEIGFSRTVQSQVLGEERPLMISLPDGHAQSSTSYPVVYLLDGSSHFTHTVGLLRFLTSNGEAPPTIVVGIPNTDRARDLTPPTTHRPDEFPTAGGVDDFLNFLRSEVFPLVEADYRGSQHRTLIGHSLGGLTVLHALIHHPEDYDNLLAISPSLWWDKQRLVEQAASAFENGSRDGIRLYMTMGSEGGEMLGGMRRIEALLSESPPAGFAWESRLLPDENHGTVPYRSALLGFDFLLEEWTIPDLSDRALIGGWPGVEAAYAESASLFGTVREFDDLSLVQLVDSLLSRGRHEELLDLLDAAPEAVNVSAPAYQWIGDMARGAGKRETARRALRSALELNPGSEALRMELTEVGGDPGQVPRPEGLSVEEAAALAGSYRGSLDGEVQTLVVRSEGASLIADLPNGPTMPLNRVEGDRFQLFDGFLKLEFLRSDTGAVTAISFETPGNEPQTLQRIGTETEAQE